MSHLIMFDLSEVFIAGLPGIEKELRKDLAIAEDKIIPCFGAELLHKLFVGDISEADYLKHIIAREKWEISVSRLKAVIRSNFHNKNNASLSILKDLAVRYDVVLLSDHAREWGEYIQSIHPFLRMFKQMFFSYDSKRTKQDPQAFLNVLNTMSTAPDDCLFIDDRHENVKIAMSVGIESIRFVNADKLAMELKNRHLLANTFHL